MGLRGVSSTTGTTTVHTTETSVREDVRQIRGQRSPSVDVSRINTISPSKPSPIDFSRIDSRLRQIYTDEIDLKPALRAAHVRAYSERLSRIQDSIDSRKALFHNKELEILEKQIKQDDVLTSGEKKGLVKYLQRVRKDLRPALRAAHVSEYARRLSNIQDRLLQGQSIELLKKEVSTIEKEIRSDAVLKKSIDRKAIMAYLNEVKQIMSRLSHYEGTLRVLYSRDLTSEKITREELNRIKEEINAFRKEIQSDRSLKIGKDDYTMYLSALNKKIDERLVAVNDFIEFNSAIDCLEAKILDKDFDQLCNECRKAIEDNKHFRNDNTIYKERLLKRLAELENNHRDVVSNIKNIPSLSKVWEQGLLSVETLESLMILNKHGYLQNTQFQLRLDSLLRSGLKELFTEKSPLEQTEIEENLRQWADIANSIIPMIARGKVEFIDFLLRGAHLDDFALQMKLTLNKELSPEEIKLRHELSIAKREFARLLEKVAGKQKERFQGSFYDLVFNKSFLLSLIENPTLRYRNINLLLARVLLLEDRLGSLSLTREEKERILKGLGIDMSVESLEKAIQQRFRSTDEITRAITDIRDFIVTLNKDNEAKNALAKTLVYTNDTLMAEELLKTIYQKTLGIMSPEGIEPSEIKRLIQSKYSFFAKKQLEAERDKLANKRADAVKEIIKFRGKESFIGYNSAKKIRRFYEVYNSGTIDGKVAAARELKGISPDALHTKSSIFSKDVKQLNALVTRSEIKEFHARRNEILHNSKTIEKDLNKFYASVEDVLGQIKDLLDQYKAKDKADAIYTVRRLEEIEQHLKKLEGSRPPESAGDLVWIAFLEDFIQSGSKTLKEYETKFSMDEIKKRLEEMGFVIKEHSQGSTIEGLSRRLEDYREEFISGEFFKEGIALPEIQKEEVEKVISEAPTEVLYLDRLKEAIQRLNTGQKLSLTFGRELSLSLDEIPAGSVDLSLQFQLMKNNSFSVLRTDEGYVIMLKKQYGGGGGASVGGFVNAVSVGAGVDIEKVRGLQMVMDSDKDVVNFMLLLLPGRHEIPSNFNPLEVAKKVAFLEESGATLKGEISASAFNAGVTLGAGVSEHRSQTTDAVYSEKTVFLQMKAEASVTASVEDFSVSKEKEVIKEKNMTEVRRFGRITPESGFVERFSSIDELREFLLKEKERFAAKVSSQQAGTSHDVQQLEKATTVLQSLGNMRGVTGCELVYKLKEDAAFKINEAELNGRTTEARSMLSTMDNYYPAEIKIIFNRDIERIRDTMSLKYIQLTHNVNTATERTVTIEI